GERLSAGHTVLTHTSRAGRMPHFWLRLRRAESWRLRVKSKSRLNHSISPRRKGPIRPPSICDNRRPLLIINRPSLAEDSVAQKESADGGDGRRWDAGKRAVPLLPQY